MTITTSAIERAKVIGEEHRAAFISEFGKPPVVGKIGDWDATSWTEAWILINREFDGLEHDESYQECRLAYLKTLFASKDVA